MTLSRSPRSGKEPAEPLNPGQRWGGAPRRQDGGASTPPSDRRRCMRRATDGTDHIRDRATSVSHDRSKAQARSTTTGSGCSRSAGTAPARALAASVSAGHTAAWSARENAAVGHRPDRRMSTTFQFGPTADPLHGIMSADVRVEVALITRMVLMSVENRYPSLVMPAVAGITPALFPRRAVPCVL